MREFSCVTMLPRPGQAWQQNIDKIMFINVHHFITCFRVNHQSAGIHTSNVYIALDTYS